MAARESPTVGVEEEFLLLHPVTAEVVPDADAVIRDCAAPARVVGESMAYMVETRTAVRRSLADLLADLDRARRLVADAARDRGLAGVPSAVSPFHMPPTPLLADGDRYRELARRFPRAMRVSGTCACHVHVGVPDRETGVQVLLRVRPWLPALISLSAGSPIWLGSDTGWSSHRLRLVSHWPTAGPAPPVTSVAQYDRAVDAAIGRGAALDARSVYFLARLSPRYPTVELRMADVFLTAHETVGYAGLVRALVWTAVDDWRAGRPAEPVPQGLLRRACREAARVGPAGRHLDPLTGEPVSGWAMVDALVTAVTPRLRAHGDEEVVRTALDRIRGAGGGAQRQRRLLEEAGSPQDFVAALAEAMTGRVVQDGA